MLSPVAAAAHLLKSNSIPMERAGRSLAKLKLSGNISAEELACAAWPAAVGKRIAVHASAVALVRGNLVVGCEDGVWQKQLFYLKSHILRKIHEVLGDTTVTDVEFRIATPRRPPQVASSRVAQPPDSEDESNSIVDAGLRIIYRQSRKKAAG
jgi:predicted nucleic acid-binding Zn ribbon protein